VLKYLRRRGINHRVVGIVGFNQNARDLYELLTADVSYGYRVLGYFTDESKDVTLGAKVFGKLDDIHEEIDRGRVEEVYVAVTTTNSSRVKRIIRHCERKGVRVKIIPNFQKYTSSHSVDINYYSTVPVLSIRREPLSKLPNIVLKRSFDILFSIIVLVGILSWLYPFVALIIKLNTKGPVIFRQRRSGIDGEVFTCYKFRTMEQNEDSNRIGTQDNDPRITKVGKFLRKSRIDELPQFINVLIGNMSIVGPRPHMIIHTEVYSELIDEFMIRHYVKPGITGWAQTVGYLDANQKLKEMKEKVKNDIWYIENWSFLLDIKIIVNTTLNIFRDDPNAK
jgi:undecaprenyl-phosphate galactose phosphotransferase/putative colanic acid biosynthesis UDP-glucose lipid carrier transferase